MSELLVTAGNFLGVHLAHGLDLSTIRIEHVGHPYSKGKINRKLPISDPVVIDMAVKASRKEVIKSAKMLSRIYDTVERPSALALAYADGVFDKIPDAVVSKIHDALKELGIEFTSAHREVTKLQNGTPRYAFGNPHRDHILVVRVSTQPIQWVVTVYQNGKTRKEIFTDITPKYINQWYS